MVTKRSRILLFCAGLAVILGVVGITCPSASAQPLQLPEINLQIGGEAEGPEGVTQALQILVILTVLALAPAILVMVTSFTRIIVVLAFVRNALATQQMPPNQVLIGLALFLTFCHGPCLAGCEPKLFTTIHERGSYPRTGVYQGYAADS